MDFYGTVSFSNWTAIAVMGVGKVWSSIGIGGRIIFVDNRPIGRKVSYMVFRVVATDAFVQYRVADDIENLFLRGIEDPRSRVKNKPITIF